MRAAPVGVHDGFSKAGGDGIMYNAAIMAVVHVRVESARLFQDETTASTHWQCAHHRRTVDNVSELNFTSDNHRNCPENARPKLYWSNS